MKGSFVSYDWTQLVQNDGDDKSSLETCFLRCNQPVGGCAEKKCRRLRSFTLQAAVQLSDTADVPAAHREATDRRNEVVQVRSIGKLELSISALTQMTRHQ